jgi:hypothetical protein
MHPSLTAGSTYWLVVSPLDSSAQVGWQNNSIGDVIAGGDFLDNQNGVWKPETGFRPAFQIDATPTAVSEPSSFILIGVTFAFAFFAWRFNRRPNLAVASE